jgi:capsular polysaccharide export protein
MTRPLTLVDSALKPLRSKLTGALSGLVTGPDDEAFRKARGQALTKGAAVTVVLPGPLPMNGTGYPGSLVYVTVSGDILEKAENAEQAACAVLLHEAEKTTGGDEEATLSALQAWRACNPDPYYSAADGSRGKPAEDGDVLRELLTLGTGAVEAEAEAEAEATAGFWSRWANDVVESNADLDTHLALVLNRHCLWFEPYDAVRCSFETMLLVARLIQRQWRDNDTASHCFGAQYWNHPAIGATFRGCGGDVAFHDSEEETLSAACASGGRVLSWAGKTTPAFEEQCRRAGVSLLRIEDGFLRSVGLGAGLARGASLAVDDTGIYYDPSRPSRLETLLETSDVSEADRTRGEDLIRKAVAARVSKYNFGKARSFRFPDEREVVLVPGQVADDAAIRKSMSSTIDCANTPNVNRDLLRLARERAPDAYIVFKPHPDVETGLRKGKLGAGEVLQYADEIAQNADIIDLIEAVDRIETFSSLSGFEALMRGKQVTVHGLPFYAGWGISDDLTESPRRTRRRTIAELVFLAFCVYSRTIDPVTLLPCTPEFLIGRLAAQRRNRWHVLRSTVLRQASWFGRKIGL